jgi:hypothetical protein
MALGVETFEPTTGMSKPDLVVLCGDGRIFKLQIKLAYQAQEGAPFIQLRCSDGRRSRLYEGTEVDFFIGYDLYSDSAHVWAWEELKGRTAASCHPNAPSLEAWHKILQPVAQSG